MHKVSARSPRFAKRPKIIIQRLEVRATEGMEYKYYPANRKDFDPTKFILDYADARDDMQVYVGLREDQSFQSSSNWDNGDSYALSLNKQGGELDKNKALAKEAWARYGIAADGKIRRSFAGWYLPNEMWNQNYTRVQLSELRRFHQELSAYLKSLGTSNLRVVISPYFNPNLSELPNLLDSDAFSKMFGEFLHPEGTQGAIGIDIIMLQDGAGARSLKPTDIKQTIEPYYLSFRAMAQTKRIHLWATVESWKHDSPNSFFPSEIDRLSKQIEVEGSFVEALVTFDFFHYMNPYGDFHPGAWKEAEKNLYWCYVRRFVPSAIRPNDPACLNLASH